MHPPTLSFFFLAELSVSEELSSAGGGGGKGSWGGSLIRAGDNARVMKESKSLCWESELQAETDAVSESKEQKEGENEATCINGVLVHQLKCSVKASKGHGCSLARPPTPFAVWPSFVIDNKQSIGCQHAKC